jgi:hypothetical protein
MQQSIVKFIALSHRRRSKCFGHYYAHHQEPFQTAVASPGFRLNAEVDVFPAVVGLLEFSRQGCIKVIKIKFHENPSSRSRTETRWTDIQTYRHYEANRRFSRLMLNAPKRLPWTSLGSSCFTPLQPYKWSFSCSEILLFEEKVSLSTVLAIKRRCSHKNLALTALCSYNCHMFWRNTSV